MMTKSFAAWAAAAGLSLASIPACGVDGAAIEAGAGNGPDLARVVLQWDWKRRWFEGPAWHLGGYWEASAGRWHANAAPGQNARTTDLGLTPVFRLQPAGLRGPYIEAGIGFHLLSATSIGGRRLSTRFQFGDHVGVGYRFGARQAWDVGYRYQHLSNAGIKHPNDGVDFHQLRLQYHF